MDLVITVALIGIMWVIGRVGFEHTEKQKEIINELIRINETLKRKD